MGSDSGIMSRIYNLVNLCGYEIGDDTRMGTLVEVQKGRR